MEVGKVIKRGEDLFFFFLLFTFENNRNLFWVYENGNFSTGKKHFTPAKKSGNMTLPPQKNMPVTPLGTPFFSLNFNLKNVMKLCMLNHEVY